MVKPELVIKMSERVAGGSLYTHDVKKIKPFLLSSDFILLPSDTCYAVAVIARDSNTPERINSLLSRPRWPISLTFPDIGKVEKWVTLTDMTATLLEQFTPGPITVVCKANTRLQEAFTRDVIDSKANTIGVRIPDSVVERQVAECTEYPTTTVAVREPNTEKVVKDFDRAMELVANGMDRITNSRWVAIEGNNEFYVQNSTVVYEIDIGAIHCVREGDIPLDKILKASEKTSQWSKTRMFLGNNEPEPLPLQPEGRA